MPAAMIAKAASGSVAKPGRSGSRPVARSGARRQASRTNTTIVVLRVLVAVLIVAIAASIWYVELGPYATQQAANQRVLTDMASAQQAANQAQGQDPSKALAQLAVARQQLVDDLNNPNVDQQTRSQANYVLNVDLEPVVQQSIPRYNDAALITTLSGSDVLGASVQCINPQTTTSAPLTNTATLVTVGPAPLKGGAKPPQLQVLYGLKAGQVYQIRLPTDAAGSPTMSGISCTQMVLSGVTAVVALAADGSTIYALAQLANTQYAVLAFVPTGYDRNDCRRSPCRRASPCRHLAARRPSWWPRRVGTTTLATLAHQRAALASGSSAARLRRDRRTM